MKYWKCLERGGGGGGDGDNPGGGSGSGGGGEPNPQGHDNAANPGALSDKMIGKEPEIFEGDQNKVKEFMTVADPSVTLAHKVGPGLQDLQKRGRGILAEQNAKKVEENMWISRMVAAKSITELDGLIRSCAA